MLTTLSKKMGIDYKGLGIGDPVTPGPQKKQTPSLLSGNDEISWSVYPIETICAEKLHALIPLFFSKSLPVLKVLRWGCFSSFSLDLFAKLF